MQPTYYYPNRMGRVILASMRQELGTDRLKDVLEAAGYPQLSTSGLLPNNLDKKFAFETIAALQAGVEQVFGIKVGRQINYRIGKGTLELGLRDFNPVLGIADLPKRMLPLSVKFKVGLDVFARVFNQFSDQVVKLGETSTHHQWIIERCPVCWGRHTDEPCCQLAAGLLEEAVFWASGGRRFSVEQTACVAMGAESCTFLIDKRPLE
jgi:predicted hydrocarbon binding protein